MKKLRVRASSLGLLAAALTFVSVITLTAGTGQASATRTSASFFSPSGNIACQMNLSLVRCLTRTPHAWVDLHRDGSLATCHGITCQGDLGEDAFVLDYGKSVRVGGFRCTLRKHGMKCVRVKSGKGFRISKAGIKRLP